MIYDIKEFLKKFFGSRLFVLAAVMAILFTILIIRIFVLQIVKGASYQENFTLKIQKELTIEAARGNIYDCNGKLLAYNELAYSVTIIDSESYDTDAQKNQELNKKLAEVISVINDNGESIYNDFKIVYNPDGSYSYTVEGAQLKRFLADVFGASSYDNLKYNETFDFDEANASPEQVMEYLMHDKNKFQVDESYDAYTAYQIVVVRYAMWENRYSKYKSTVIAQDISDETVAYIKEHSDRLNGVDITEDTIRKYNDSIYFASIIGYTGKISTEEYEQFSMIDGSYSTTDTVGKSGLEQYYENYLRGQNGKQEVYIDNVGRISEIINTTESVAGNDLYITIDSELQKATYLLLEQEIAGIVYKNIREGNIPIEDVYVALIDNNVIDVKHFSEETAAVTEKEIYSSFSGRQQATLDAVYYQLNTENPVIINDMDEATLDYFTYIIAMLKENDVLLSSEIDVTDSTYIRWKEGKISPKEYLKYCISQQWIDISLLDVNDKYADSLEIYSALCSYIMIQSEADVAFSKLVYKYMILDHSLSGTKLCLTLFEQGVLDYDDASYQKLSNGSTSAYSFILNKINNIEITPAQLALDPCTGSCVITDVNTGEIKALVSYPGYDNNMLANEVNAAYYQKLTEDHSNPLYNYATQEKTAPGSTFKLVTSTAALAENVVTTSSEIECTGIFKEVSNEPECWIYPSTHGHVNVSEAIRDSCNIFYYTMGYELSKKESGNYDDHVGISYISKYATIYGLDQKTGLEIEENESDIATQYPVMAAIGQSDNNYTTVALSRYITAVTSGKLYNYQLMSKITDPDGNIIQSYEPVYEDVSHTLNDSQWNAIYSGMRMVCENMKSFNSLTFSVAGKTGTAQQVENRPNHALFVGYAPYENPQISITTRIAYGYSSHNAADVSRNILSYYFQQETLDSILSRNAAGVNSSSDNTRTD